jgi:hypothetical protein
MRSQEQSWWISTTALGVFEPEKKLNLLAVCLEGAKFREILNWISRQSPRFLGLT